MLWRRGVSSLVLCYDVLSILYWGDMLSVDRDADAAVEARIRIVVPDQRPLNGRCCCCCRLCITICGE